MRRVSIDVPDELFADIARAIPWGIRQRLLNCILEQLVKLADENGEMGLAAIMSGKLSLLEVMSSVYVGRSAPVNLDTAGGRGDARSASDQTKSENPEETKGSDGVGGTDPK